MDRILRSGVWWIPLTFALAVAALGGYAYRTLADSMRADLRAELQTILDAEVAALRLWVDSHKAATGALGRDGAVRAAALELVALSETRLRSEQRETLLAHPALERVDAAVAPLLGEGQYSSYALLTTDGRVLASSVRALVGEMFPLRYEALQRVLGGETVITRPFQPPPIPGVPPQPPVIRVGAPVRDAAGEVVAVIGLVLPAERFGEVMRIARKGESGETYAFDAQGVMLSRSRFDAQLREIGLLDEEETSLLTVQIRAPRGDMTEGYVPELPMRSRPLTRMAGAAIDGENGFDIDGYRDYRGVPVVGAWAWLPEFGVGITTELDHAEAYAGLSTIRITFIAIAGALALAAVAMLGYTVVIGRLQRRVESARKLGRYRIVEKIGEGGMGKVYRAEHALLRRPTAVKLLEAGKANEEAVARFEREVQAVASFTHPNTVSIFDFGRTPDGTFYYAMEYLEGINFSQLVSTDGPQQEARAVHLLRQAAASLSEAHGRGMIHRDLKPSNLMLCRCGGMYDFVKVLDFGLVRGQEDDLNLTSTQALTGTPLFLSPEALEDPAGMDVRSDVYQLGAVLYYLLTGRPVFEGESLVEILSQHLKSAPLTPSEVLGRPVMPQLEALVMQCLAKDREARPADARELLDALEKVTPGAPWAQTDAELWWEQWHLRHPGGVSEYQGSSSTGSTLPSGWSIDALDRLRGSGSRS